MQLGAQIVLSGVQLILAGLGIGILMAAPVGPVNVLVIQRALSRGFWGGLAAGLGAVAGDGLLAAVAAFSVTAISDVITAHQRDIQVAGGALLIAFGVGLLFTKPQLTVPLGQKSKLGAHTSIIPQTFFLTVTNPGAILGMAALVGGLGTLVGGLGGYVEALILVVSVMCGSLLWWLGLSELISHIRHMLTESRLKLINRIAGIVLVGFGLLLLLDGVSRYFR